MMADVGCAGILVADTFCGPMPHMPQEGQLMTIDSMPTTVGGCAANVGIGLVKQELSVDVAGCVGQDTSANVVMDCLKQEKVNCDHVVSTDKLPTSQTVILLIEGQDRRYIHVFGANAAYAASHIDRDWLESLKAFYVGGYFALPGLETRELDEIFRFCRSKGIITILDVVTPQAIDGFGTLTTLLPHVDYFLPNDDEAAKFTGQSNLVDQIRAIQDLGTSTVIITCGEKGAVAAQGGTLWRSEIYRMDAIDPSGSGDGFTTGAITAILRGFPMPHVLQYASALGASATRAVGCTGGLFVGDEAETFIKKSELKIEESTL